MGCGTSNNAVIANEIKFDAAAAPIIQSSRQEKELQTRSKLPQLGPEMSESTTINVLITCHSNQQHIAEKFYTNLTNSKFTCYILTDATPQSIIARANLIRWCDVFIVLLSRSYQRTYFCMEAINYAKDVRRPIITILVESNFQAYGALGAISASAVQSMILGDDGVSENFITKLCSSISNNKATKKNKNVIDPQTIETKHDNVNLMEDETQYAVLICTVDDGATVGQLIYNELTTKNFNVSIENFSKGNVKCSVRRCTVFLPILTPQLEHTQICRAAFEEARRLHKPIVPVIATKNWRPEDWVGLTIAGCTFFRIFDKESAYKAIYDSNPMTNLSVEVEVAFQPIPTQVEREKAEAQALKEKIEECKCKLRTWPPIRKSRNLNVLTNRSPVRVKLDEPSAKLPFTHIHYSLVRMDIKAPIPMLDKYGLPMRKVLDCMISYQWDKQKFVRKVYEDMSMREIRTWFDIWSYMQGNSNEAMATGVECAKVLLVFLSTAYIESLNCQMEFRYAVKRGKAFVIIRTEPNIRIDQWMLESIEGFPQYEIFSYDALETLVNEVPMIDVIMQAVRKLAHAQTPDVVDDCSAELFELRCLYDDALDAISAETGQSRFKRCTRCGQQYDENTKDGCKNHRSYYLGGTILEGRWVCCRQQDKDSPGCNPCDHTDVTRVLTQDPSYGTWTWVPS